MNRRDFLKHSVAAGAAASAGLFSLKARGANDRVIVGLMGAGGRGNFLVQEFAKRPDVEIRYIADPDSRRLEGTAKAVEGITKQRPKCVQDFRRMLEDAEVNAIINATPDHWHAPGTIFACQAGKDVYVEKPASHSIWEGRKMIEAARTHKRVVQVGAQGRSGDYCREAIAYAHSDKFGDIHLVRVLNSKPRGAFAKKPDLPGPPEGVDYDMWLGAAPLRPFNENRFHGGWNWYWDYSGGDIINDGVHQIDLARWLIGKDYPAFATAAGGKWGMPDDQDTPDTFCVNWDYDGLTMVFEQAQWAPYLNKTPLELRDVDEFPNWPFNGTRIEVYGTREMMYFGRHGDGWQAFGSDGKPVAGQPGKFTPMNTGHIANFIDCIRSRNLPNGDIEQLHLSTLLCHYGNIAYRVGRRVQIDAKTEGFLDDADANALVKRSYRAPWVIPDVV